VARSTWIGHSPAAWLVLPGIVYLGLLFVLPLLRLGLISVESPQFTLQQYERIFSTPAYVAVLITTLEISLSVTILCLLLGFPVAYALTTGSKGLRSLLLIGIILPYFTSVLIRTFAWLVLLGRAGVLNETLTKLGIIEMPIPLLYNRLGVLIGMVHVALPLMIFPLFTVMLGIDQRLVKAAKALGASPLRAFLTVFLPLSLPGVIAGTLLVFIYCLGFYITPALMGGLSDTTITMAISAQIIDQLNWGFGSALAIVLLGVVLAVIAAGSRLFPVEQLLGLKTASRATGQVGRRGMRWSGVFMVLAGGVGLIERWLPQIGSRPVRVVAVLIVLVLVLPIAVVVYLSFSSATYLEFPAPGYSLQNYGAFFSDPVWIRSTLTSARVGLMATAIATTVGTMLAYGLVRGRVPARAAVLGLVLSPLIVPAVVIAIATYFLLVRVNLQGTEFGLALAHAVHAIPYVVLVVSANLQGVDLELERAARSLGASAFATFRTITGPLIRPALIVASFFAFLTSFDDIIFVLFLGLGRVNTLPMRMWEGVKQDVNPTISAVASLEMLLAVAIVAVSTMLTRKTAATTPP
jgi:putative spermidine/putrescine transport system permease protein